MAKEIMNTLIKRIEKTKKVKKYNCKIAEYFKIIDEINEQYNKQNLDVEDICYLSDNINKDCNIARVCSVCHKLMTGEYIEGSGNTYYCSAECFHIDFWNEIVTQKDKHIFIEGKSYLIGDENDISSFRGCDGRHFRIRLNTGKIIDTTNLWCQGAIPEKFRDILKDNAKFL